MISEFVIGLAAGFVEWLASLFGEWEPPDVLTDADSAVKAILSGLAGLGVWVDWTVLGSCIAASLIVWASVVGIKLVRAVAAHIPLFGGAGD